jgi:hypothetical protein
MHLSTTSTSLVLHANSWVRRLRELLLRLLLSASRVLSFSRMTTAALFLRAAGWY